jgi:peroxiredoxin
LGHPQAAFISHRASVVIDKQGKVVFVQVQEKTSDERNWSELQGALKKLK